MANDRQPKQTPRLPAATSPADEPGASEGQLEPPSTAGQALIAAHLADGHGIEPFVLAEHVHLGGPRPQSQLITWHPANASFHCERCPGMVFPTGEITPEQIQVAQMFDETLRPHLVGLTRQEDRDEMTRLHLQGVSNRERLRQLRGIGAKRRAKSGTRPASEEFKRRAQHWLLSETRGRGSLRAALDGAEELQRVDPDRWLRLVGRHYARETLRKHWLDVDPRLRDEALERAAEVRGRRSSPVRLPRQPNASLRACRGDGDDPPSRHAPRAPACRTRAGDDGAGV